LKKLKAGSTRRARKQQDVEYRHRRRPRPHDVVPVEPHWAQHRQDEQMHRHRCHQRGAAKPPGQQADTKCNLHERRHHPEAMKKISCGWKPVSDGLDDPRKIILHKIRVYLLQA
jgi:hypothetical protein